MLILVEGTPYMRVMFLNDKTRTACETYPRISIRDRPFITFELNVSTTLEGFMEYLSHKIVKLPYSTLFWDFSKNFKKLYNAWQDYVL